MEFSVRRPSPNTYSFVREENLGSTRKVVQNYLLFTCSISNLILAIPTQSVNGLENLSKTAEKKSSSPRAAGVYKKWKIST